MRWVINMTRITESTTSKNPARIIDRPDDFYWQLMEGSEESGPMSPGRKLPRTEAAEKDVTENAVGPI
jgi:hypothetical protein